MDYWKECVAEAFEDAGITATDEQIDTVTSWVAGAHENYGMAHGHECTPNPLADELKRTKVELEKERDKRICEACKGKGYIRTDGPCHYSESQCSKCRGEGKI